jgi:hypothetical protein
MDSPAALLPVCLLGVGAGLFLLWRGLSGYRTALAVGDTATSAIDSLAAGEVRISGAIEAAEVTLVSPLQSVPQCVWYRARVRAGGDDDRDVFAEERAIGFRVRDEGGSIRVFPAGARIGGSLRFDGRTGFMGDEPAGYRPRTGSAYGTAMPPEGWTPLDREAAIAALLTVKMPELPDPALGTDRIGAADGRRHYEEARLEVGDLVTVVGTALPFGHLPDPFGADRMDRASDPLVGLDDPLVAAEVAEARAAGTLLTAEEAWGNAAIPGFGIGKPVREPELHPEADRPALAPEEQAREAAARFDIHPDTLVLAVTQDSPLLIAEGAPEAIVAREQGRFLVGLLGAVLAVSSAIVAAVVIGGLPT